MKEHLLHFLHAARLALENYDVGKVAIDESKEVGHIGFSGYHMVKFRADGSSGSFLVTVYYADGDRNIHSYRTDVHSHLHWLEALSRDTDLVIQKPIRSRSGDFITELQSDGEWSFLVTLLCWVEGEVAWDNYSDEVFVDLPSGILHNVGTVLGKLHRHSSRWTLPDGFFRPGSEAEDMPRNLNRLRLAADEGRVGAGDFAVMEQAASHIIADVAGMDKSPQDWGLLHGDFSCGNCIVHRGEVRPIDFDWCCFGYFPADVGWCFAVNPMNPALCQAFLDGYRQQHTLPDNYLQIIECFFIESCIRLLSWRAENPKADFLTLSCFIEGACKKYLNDERFVLEWMEDL